MVGDLVVVASLSRHCHGNLEFIQIHDLAEKEKAQIQRTMSEWKERDMRDMRDESDET